MLQRRYPVVLLFLVAILFGSGKLEGADYPPYLILQSPPSGPHHASRGHNPGTPHRVSTPAYSYGYFGVEPRKHASRHFGYYRNYTEWSCR